MNLMSLNIGDDGEVQNPHSPVQDDVLFNPESVVEGTTPELSDTTTLEPLEDGEVGDIVEIQENLDVVVESLKNVMSLQTTLKLLGGASFGFAQEAHAKGVDLGVPMEDFSWDPSQTHLSLVQESLKEKAQDLWGKFKVFLNKIMGWLKAKLNKGRSMAKTFKEKANRVKDHIRNFKAIEDFRKDLVIKEQGPKRSIPEFSVMGINFPTAKHKEVVPGSNSIGEVGKYKDLSVFSEIMDNTYLSTRVIYELARSLKGGGLGRLLSGLRSIRTDDELSKLLTELQEDLKPKLETVLKLDTTKPNSSNPMRPEKLISTFQQIETIQGYSFILGSSPDSPIIKFSDISLKLMDDANALIYEVSGSLESFNSDLDRPKTISDESVSKLNIALRNGVIQPIISISRMVDTGLNEVFSSSIIDLFGLDALMSKVARESFKEEAAEGEAITEDQPSTDTGMVENPSETSTEPMDPTEALDPSAQAQLEPDYDGDSKPEGGVLSLNDPDFLSDPDINPDASSVAPNDGEGTVVMTSEGEVDLADPVEPSAIEVAAESLKATSTLLQTLRQRGVIDTGFALESNQRFGSEYLLPVEYYTRHGSKTNYDLTMESLIHKGKAAAKRIIDYLRGLWEKIIKFIKGDKGKKLEAKQETFKRDVDHLSKTFKSAVAPMVSEAPSFRDATKEDVEKFIATSESTIHTFIQYDTAPLKNAGDEGYKLDVGDDLPEGSLGRLFGIRHQYAPGNALAKELAFRHYIKLFKDKVIPLANTIKSEIGSGKADNDSLVNRVQTLHQEITAEVDDLFSKELDSKRKTMDFLKNKPTTFKEISDAAGELIKLAETFKGLLGQITPLTRELSNVLSEMADLLESLDSSTEDEADETLENVRLIQKFSACFLSPGRSIVFSGMFSMFNVEGVQHVTDSLKKYGEKERVRTDSELTKESFKESEVNIPARRKPWWER